MTVFAPMKFEISSSLAKAADVWTAEVPDADFFLEASPEDRVTLSAGYMQDGEPQRITLIDAGVIDYYRLTMGTDWKLKVQLQGRDQMARLQDVEYRQVFRNGPAPAVTDGAITVPELEGRFMASEIAATIAAAAGLALQWEAPDYPVNDYFQAVGRPIDLITQLVRPFSLLEARTVDVFTQGATLYVRQRQLAPIAPAVNTFTVKDARIKSLQVRKFQTDKIGLVSLQGMLVPTNGAGAGGSPTGTPGPGVPFLTWPTPAPITWPAALSATQLNATANVPGEFTYSPGDGVTPEPPGNVTLTANFTPTDASAYKAGTIKVTLVVEKVAPTLIWADPADAVAGTALGDTQLNCIAHDEAGFPLDGAFAYSPAPGTILTAGTKTLSVKFTPADSTHYAIETASVTLTVTGVPPASTPTVTWDDPAGIVYGQPLTAAQLNATADVAGTMTYTPGLDTVLSPGLKTLKVLFTPDDPATYKDVTATVTILVTRARVVWNRPPDLVAGGALDGTQLNAVANVPGSFVYDPPSGTVMPDVGSVTLNATFTPTADGASPVSASATLRVVADPSQAGGGATTGLLGPIEESNVTYGANGAAVGVVHTKSWYRMPGQLLVREEKVTYGPDLGASNVILVPQQTDTKILTYEDTIVGPNGTALNQPRQLSEWTVTTRSVPVVSGSHAGAIFSISLQSVETADSFVAYTYDDIGSDGRPVPGPVDPRGLLKMTTQIDRVLPTDVYPVSAAVIQAGLQPNAMTVKSYRDHTPDFYLVTTDTYQWRQIVQGSAIGFTTDFVWAQVGSDQAPQSGTRPGGINSSAGALPSAAAPAGPQDTALLSWDPPEAITYPTALDETQLNATADIPGTFVYSPSAGAVLTPGSKTLLVTFTPTDAATYKVSTATVTITVNKATPSLTWSDPGDIAEGTALDGTQLNATADVPGTFAYKPASGTLLKAGTHTLAVTFTPTDTTGYAPATASVTLTVTGTPPAGTPSISWTPTSPITGGVAIGTAQLNATAEDSGTPVPGVFAYTPPAGTVLPAGTHTLRVRFTPDDAVAYKDATASVTIDVTRVEISWGKPASVEVGTALDDTQLDATANMDGAFVYKPPAGTVLSAVGSVTLAVTFTPDGGGTAVSKSVTIDVVKSTSGAAGSAGGLYAAVERTVDADPTAPPVDLSDNNLDQATLDLIFSQLAECSGLWQWEVTLSGAGIPWLRRGDLLQLTDLADNLGTPIPLPALLVRDVKLTYDEAGSHSVTRELVGLAWTKS